MNPIVRPSVKDDAVYLADHLRQEDLQEVLAATGESPQVLLPQCYAASNPCFTVEAEGRLFLMFGVSARGAIWMLATPELQKISRPFLKESRAWVQLLLKQFGRLWNIVDERNDSHIKWIKWCGFSFTGRYIYLADPSVKFLEFQLCVSP